MNYKQLATLLWGGFFLYEKIMELDLIPFKIGMQYENWEFELEPYSTSKATDTYKYLGNEKCILGIEAKLILLSFSLDILEEVEYYFDAVSFGLLKDNIEKFPGKCKEVICDYKDYRIIFNNSG